jgi:hypothetical protein
MPGFRHGHDYLGAVIRSIAAKGQRPHAGVNEETPLATHFESALNELPLSIRLRPISQACSLRIRPRRNAHSNLSLEMTFHARLGRAATFFSPYEGQVRAQYGLPLLEGCQRDPPTVGGKVRGIRREAYKASFAHDSVVRMRGVVRRGKFRPRHPHSIRVKLSSCGECRLASRALHVQ